LINLIGRSATDWFYNPTISLGLCGILAQNTQEKKPDDEGLSPGDWLE
jgi:hypothetical protein